jgi:acyl-CoA thioester hydrolase, YbgC/YbaW family
MRSCTKIIVRYAETDQMGVVHHSNYPIWYEAARVDLIKNMGISYEQLEEEGIILPLIRMESKFIKPALFGNEVIVEVRLVKLTQVKMELHYKVYREKEEKPINEGLTAHGIVGKDMKPIMLKKKFPELYEKLLKACETI